MKFDVTAEARKVLQTPLRERTPEQLRVLSRWTRNVPLLAMLSEKARIELASVLQYQPLYGGFILAKAGDGSPNVHIVLSGKAVLRSKEAGMQRVLTACDSCGELPLLDPTLETPTVFIPENGTRDVVTEVRKGETLIRFFSPPLLILLSPSSLSTNSIPLWLCAYRVYSGGAYPP